MPQTGQPPTLIGALLGVSVMVVFKRLIIPLMKKP